MSTTVNILGYELECELSSPPSPASYDDPGDGGEVEIDNIVGIGEEVVTYETFLREYCIVTGLSPDDACNAVHDQALEAVLESYYDRYDDRGDD